jgi:hypothetical protein
MPLPSRSDLLAEVDTTLDATGAYSGTWFDSTGTLSARFLYFFTNNPAPQVLIEESSDMTNFLASDQLLNGASFQVTARYFRITASGGAPGATFRFAIRRVS